ncbi:MAG: hypothetical protein KDK36_01265, partial [Leptospiraceae bacterium]|nr:hypothetical protein [Leptospiraceae bacterium]
EFINHTIKNFNLKLRFPFTWRWKKLNPKRNEGRVFEVFSPNRKFHIQVWAEKTRNIDNIKSFKSYLRKQNFDIEESPDYSTSDYPNLQSLNSYMVKFKEFQNGKSYRGYFFTGTDGIWLFTFKLNIENSIYEDSKNTITEVLSGIDTNHDWQQLCCAACLKEIRYSMRRTTLCSDFIGKNPCYSFFKNTKLHYEDCR